MRSAAIPVDLMVIGRDERTRVIRLAAHPNYHPIATTVVGGLVLRNAAR